MKNTLSNRLFRAIQNSDLKEHEKQEMFGFYGHIGDSELDDTVVLFETNPELIGFFYEDMKKKEGALRDNNLQAFEDVFDDEIEMIENLV